MKRIILIVFFLLFAGISYSQESPGTLITVGHTFQNDISISIGGKVFRDKDIIVAYDHTQNFATKCQSNYINIGIGNDKQIVLFKYGAATKPYEHTHIHYTDYGVEYLWVYRIESRNLLYGLSFTRENGFAIKAGLAF
jgi:hypothetical protein